MGAMNLQFLRAYKIKKFRRCQHLNILSIQQIPVFCSSSAGPVSDKAKISLETVYNSLNPFKLKRRIDDKLKAVFHIVRLPNP